MIYIHACDPNFLQNRRAPLSSALTKELSRINWIHVTSPSWPGRVSNNPRSVLSCVWQNLVFLAASEKMISYSSIPERQQPGTTENDERIGGHISCMVVPVCGSRDIGNRGMGLGHESDLDIAQRCATPSVWSESRSIWHRHMQSPWIGHGESCHA